MGNVITSWGTAIWTSLTATLALVFAFIPKLVGFLVILIVGLIVAKALEKLLTLILRKVGFDRAAQRIGLTRLEQQMSMRMDPAALLGKIVYWFVFLIFLIPAIDALGLTSVSNLLGQVIDYIPNVFVAILVLFAGAFIANFVADIVHRATSNSRHSNIFTNITRYVILGFVVLIALYQLQIAPAMIETLFTAIVGAAALALALAFGLGGREAAQRWLARGENTLTSTPMTSPSQTYVNQASTNAPSQTFIGKDATQQFAPRNPEPVRRRENP